MIVLLQDFLTKGSRMALESLGEHMFGLHQILELPEIICKYSMYVYKFLTFNKLSSGSMYQKDYCLREWFS